ncbi:MAG: hypothetical protein J2P54_05515 [Bradyrhizobiaceae bacterium]|nr:hypothetical protein [Bradyrhizobiaceae bacterium]
MPIKIVAKKSGYGIKDGVCAHSKEVLITGMPSVPGIGFVDIVIRIDGESFKQLAQAMMDANASEAIKAFGAAMQSGIDRERAPNLDRTEKGEQTEAPSPRPPRRSLATPHV